MYDLWREYTDPRTHAAALEQALRWAALRRDAELAWHERQKAPGDDGRIDGVRRWVVQAAQTAASWVV